MTSKPRLLIVGAFPPPGSRIIGGVATSCRVLLQSSLPARVDLVLVDSSQITNPPPGFVVRLLLAMRRCLEFAWKVETRRPASVWLFASPGASAVEKGVMAWYARLRGRRVTLLPRGRTPARAGGRAAGILNGLCFGGAHRIVCQGTAWQDFVVEVLGRSRADAPIVRNWTATDEYLQIGRERTLVDRTPVRLLYVGWVEEEKGALDLLAACDLLGDADFELDVVGDGRAMNRVREWIAARGRGRVRAHGWLHGAEKLERLRAADVFVLPSWSEGLPNAMIEAMAARMACVLTDVGNIRDAAGEAVLLTPPRDIPALAQGLARVIADPALRADLARRGFERAQREFVVEGAVERLLAASESANPA